MYCDMTTESRNRGATTNATKRRGKHHLYNNRVIVLLGQPEAI
jgi:hypothetical protein